MRKSTAKIIKAIVPAACPFARTLRVGGVSCTIPPLCKLNPFYDDLMAMRVEALEALEKN